MTIQEPLKKIFERHRIVFWYEADKGLRADYEAIFGNSTLRAENPRNLL